MTSKTDVRPVAVLVVEDDVLVRMIAADILADAGFRTLEAHNAREAMTLLEARGDVRVLFTDWNMPGDIDGLGLARLVHHRWPTVGIIVTSGKMQPRPGDLPSGPRFLSKPYRPSALIQEVEDLLHKQGNHADPGAPVVPTGTVMQTPVAGALGGEIAAAPSEPDKT